MQSSPHQLVWSEYSGVAVEAVEWNIGRQLGSMTGGLAPGSRHFATCAGVADVSPTCPALAMRCAVATGGDRRGPAGGEE